MKVLCFFILFIIFFIGLGNSYCQDKDYDFTRISITLEEKKEVVPDILKMTLSVNSFTLKEVDSINMLGALDKAVRALNLKYSGGKYAVEKNCWWEKDRRRCSGYKGNINYSFELKEGAEQNKIFDLLDKFKEQYGEKINYSVSNTTWVISDKKAEEIEMQLKLLMIDKGMNFAKKVEEKMGKKCTISNISYDIKRPFWDSPVFLKSAHTVEKFSVEAPEPKREDIEISVKANLSLICK